MNIDQSPTEKQLRELLAHCDDSKTNHLLWVSKNGDVQIEPLDKGLTPIGFVKSRPDVQFRYEAYARGNDYVGPNAAKNDDWVARVFKSLIKEWSTYKGTPTAAYIDFM